MRVLVWSRCAWLALPCAALVAPPAGARPLLAAPVEAGAPAAAQVAAGSRLWLAQRLAAGGTGVEEASSPGGRPLLAEAAARGAAYAVVPELALIDGVARVRLRLQGAGTGEVVAVSTAHAPAASIGNALEAASAQLLARMGVEAGRGAPPPPLLGELAAAGRALDHRRRGELLAAWRELEGRLSPTARGLREQVAAAAAGASEGSSAERARVLAAAGDERAAWALIQGDLERRPSPELELAGAEVQLAGGRGAAALRRLEPLARSAPRDAGVALALGRAHLLEGDEAAARNAFERAAELAPDDPLPLQLLARAQTGDPGARARSLLAAGRRAAARLDLHRAESLLRRAAELDEQIRPESWRERARLEQQTGRAAQALETWRVVSGQSPDDPEAFAAMGRAQESLGDPEALQSYGRALALAPGQPTALRGLARLHLEKGRADQAVPLLRRALAAEPDRRAVHLELARALRSRGEAAEALALLEAHPRPDDPAWLRERSAGQRELGDLEGARESLEQAVAREPYAAELLAELAALQRAAGEAAAAAVSEGLARLLEGEGAPPASGGDASRALAGPDLEPLVLGFSSQVARAQSKRVAFLGLRPVRGWREQAHRWLHPREPDHRRIAASLVQNLELRFARVEAPIPDSSVFRETLAALFDFDSRGSLDAEAIAAVNSALDTDAVVLARVAMRPSAPEEEASVPEACRGAERLEIEMRLLAGQHADLASLLADAQCLPDGAWKYTAWNRRAFAVYGVAALLLLFPVLRGWGRVVVEIKLPPRTRGFLHVRIARKPQPPSREKKRDLGGGRLKRSLRSLSRYQKRMAGRETLFRWIPARKSSYYVTVRGPLIDAMGDREIGYFLEEQPLRLARGRTERLVYDFAPSEVTLHVTVSWNGAPAPGARVAVRELPDSLRYARDGSAFYYVGKGRYAVCAGARDRATERVVEVKSLESAIPVDFELGEEAGLMVDGCAEAVEPYLIGDFEQASAALRAAGRDQLAHLMQGAHFQQRGDPLAAAEAFEAAGCLEEAAELRASGRQVEQSAALYEQLEDYDRAAEAHRAAGDLEDAARCYEAAYDYANAVECWEQLGDVERVIGLHEKTGAYLDAALLCERHGALDRALENLQQVERRDPRFAEACQVMAAVLEKRGDFDVAAERLGRAIELAGGEAAAVELHERHASLLEKAQDKRGALAAYETVRRIDPRRADVTQHIDELRREIESAGVGADPTVRAEGAESRYEILGQIGRGGMGVVLEARDKRLGRVVALKRLPDELRDNRTAAQLFLREARAAAALNHPNIVTVFDAGEENGVYHITMELLEGLPLNAIQEKRRRLSLRDTVRLGMQVCAGLQYAHDRRIVHRDIKTSNLFFTRQKVVKIMDFGLAKTIEEVRRNSTVIGGTPYYMAPEQASGEAVDSRTDLYALGVTFYRLLTGTFPFVEGDLAYQHRHAAPPDPREHLATLPAAAAELILALLAKAPADRPASAAEIAERLRALVAE